MNGGVSWTPLPLPARLRTVSNQKPSNFFPPVQQNIYFADAKDGWIYGSAPSNASGASTFPYPAEIWSTHNGGVTWSAIGTKTLGMKFDVLTVAASQGSVYAISWLTGQTFGLWKSSVATDSWQRIGTPTLYAAAGGTNMEGSLIFKGANAWLILGNDRGATASARLNGSGRWVKWTAPCFSVGNSFAVPVATSATNLVDVCTIGGFGGYIAPGTPHYLKLQSNWVFTSRDAGLSFKPTYRIMADGSSEYLDELTSLPAAPTSGWILVAKSVTHGLKVSDHLYLTRDGGRTWTSVYATPPSSFFPLIQFVGFASSSLGYAIVQRTTSSSVLMISNNGGQTWHASAT
jgi:BNR/Asp-box repeat